MATANAATIIVRVPAQSVPLLNTDGTVNDTWYRFFQRAASLDLAVAQAVVQQESLIQDLAAVSNTVATVSTQANATAISLQAVQADEEQATAATNTPATATMTVAEYLAIGS